MKTPCDYPNAYGEYHCPYEDYGGYESERCRVCCGLGVDEDSYDVVEDYEDDLEVQYGWYQQDIIDMYRRER